MSHCKILYVCQEITPYLPESDMSVLCRALSQGMQERGNEIRTFMPRYGLINERRNQLHEVIRLSGMNLIIDNNDHQLIIKVASIPSARVQIYFIDNEDYFHRKAMIRDEDGAFFADNDERAIFFARGIATVGSRPSFRYTCAMRSPTIRSSSARRSYCRFTTMRSRGNWTRVSKARFRGRASAGNI